ncbi:MAG: GGDEF domain-containing response regulator [Fervidobacterium sp.]
MKKVLIVDDSAVWRNFLKNLIESNGHSTEVAKDGLDGINKFFSFLPDVVIVDYVMPKLNGIHFTRFIRSYTATKNVGILMLTGAEETVNSFWAKKSGVNYFLKKTLPQDELEREIIRFVEEPFSFEWSREIYKSHTEPYCELVDIIEESLKESTLVREIISYSEYLYDEQLVMRKLFELLKELFEFESCYIALSSLSEIRLYGFGKNLASPEEVHKLIVDFAGVKYYSNVVSYFDGNRSCDDDFIMEIIYKKREPIGFVVLEHGAISDMAQNILSMINEPLSTLFQILNDYRNLSIGREIDEVTGLYNETYFRTRVEYAIDFALRNNIPLSFLKLKIRNLREISALSGEKIVSNILKITSDVLLEKVPDLAGRISTNEFACIFIGSKISKAENEKEDILRKVKHSLENLSLAVEFDHILFEWNGETVGEIFEKFEEGGK